MSTTPAYRRRCEFTASPKQKEAPGVTGVYLQRGRPALGVRLERLTLRRYSNGVVV